MENLPCNYHKQSIMKTYIVATDFSENAGNALHYAGALAAFTNASIILYNAYTVPVHAATGLVSATGVEELLEANNENLSKLAEPISLQYGVKITTTSKLGEIVYTIDELVAHTKADLVIMGMHEQKWSDRVFGNHTTAVIRKANYPVLVIPPEATFSGCKKILYAFDGNKEFSPGSLSVLSDVVARFNAEIQVFHVVTPNTETRENKLEETKMYADSDQAFKDITYDFKQVEEAGVINGIEKEINEFGADLLVMVPHKLNVWESLLNQSTTRSMCLRTHIPLLVLPNAKTSQDN